MALIVVNALIDLRVTGGHGRDDQVSKDNEESTKGDKGKSSKPGAKKKKRTFPRAEQDKSKGGDGKVIQAGRTTPS